MKSYSTIPLVLAVILAVAPLSFSATTQAGPNCYCRTANSELVEVGDYTCIKTNEGLREARCEFVLNNTAWKLTGNLCPVGLHSPKKEEPRINLARIDFKKVR